MSGDTVQVYLDEGGSWRWRRKALNGEIVASSGEAFDTKKGATRAAAREAGQDATVEIADEGGNEAA